MSQKKNKTQYSTEEAWNLILDKYDIVNEVKKNGVFHIKASQIKEFREPRLMSKWDSSEQLPKPLSKNKINILPDSRSSYIVFNNVAFVRFSNCNEYFICDLDNWNSILKHICWYKDKYGYAVNKTKNGALRMHRIVMDAKDGEFVDHEYQVSNGICDNRKCNLRIASRSQSNINKNYFSNKNIIGVGNNGYSYIARISYCNENIWLGSYDTEYEAIKASLEAEKKYFGELAPQKHLFEGYGVTHDKNGDAEYE